MGILRSPKWKREELILALDLYLQLDSRELYATNIRIIELSIILNKLDIHESVSEYKNFRSPNAVAMKLNNFASLDPEISGKGLTSYSKLDKELWNHFHGNRRELKLEALTLKTKESLSNLLIQSDIDMEESFKEGKLIYLLHKKRERNDKVVKKKLAMVSGKLICEACNFDFTKVYGEIGRGYIEAHHIKPLAEYKEDEETKLDDLVLLCANCHRMVHSRKQWLTIEELQKSII